MRERQTTREQMPSSQATNNPSRQQVEHYLPAKPKYKVSC